MPHTGKQVVIPPELPDILKQFTKDAIRTQPENLLEWATLYFSAMVQGQPLPVKKTEDNEVTPNTVDLTPEILATMHQQLHGKDTVTKEEVRQLWASLGLADDLLSHIMKVGGFEDNLAWVKFFALGCSYLGGTIKNALTHALYILNSDSACKPPDACISFQDFRFLYSYLAAVDREVSQAQMEQALAYLETQANAKGGLVKVSDFVNSRKVRLG
ncbi:ropporin-1 isoform X1 [Esox lucius]|uniref:Ropporin-1-like protein n=1 Tax=Esox lucius TaxID=8010 RepID=A0A3P8ZD23_ESOLU|nr:ropporin-1 isoform X1 [Esox lucius]XP_019898022.2 ropporin-1 isoform X1 [Esox lucius]XP_019898023.2 ropporin-1 isoform X1 [Esox lucius]